MKFSLRIQENCKTSTGNHWAAIAIESLCILFFGWSTWCVLGETALEYGIEEVLSFFALIYLLVMLGIIYGLALLIRFSYRRIRRNTLEGQLALQTRYGDPAALLAAVEDLPERNIPEVDLRFDETYFAYARKGDIVICPLEKIRLAYDCGVEGKPLQRRVTLRFEGGAWQEFTTQATAEANAVLEDLYRRTPGPETLPGEGAPVRHVYHSEKVFTLLCDGEMLTIDEKKGGHWEAPVTALDRAFLLCSPGGDDSDSYYLVLFTTEGRGKQIPVKDVKEGLALFANLHRCAEQLTFGYPD